MGRVFVRVVSHFLLVRHCKPKLPNLKVVEPGHNDTHMINQSRATAVLSTGLAFYGRTKNTEDLPPRRNRISNQGKRISGHGISPWVRPNIPQVGVNSGTLRLRSRGKSRLVAYMAWLVAVLLCTTLVLWDTKQVVVPKLRVAGGSTVEVCEGNLFICRDSYLTYVILWRRLS